MRNRWLVNLLLLILVLALGALMRRELEQERRVATLTELLPDRITEIKLERPRQPTLQLIQGADGWRMETPYRVAADAKRIDELAGIVATPVHRSLPGGKSAERLGLNEDSPRLTLNGLVLRFGDVDPIAGHRYVAVGEQVHLIGDGFRHHLIASAEDYVGRRLLPAGFLPGSGTLDGTPLTKEQLAELGELRAKVIEPLGSELIGRLLSLTSDDETVSLRFLVASDGLGWARLDLRLRYLLTTPPAWAVAGPATETAAGGLPFGDPDR